MSLEDAILQYESTNARLVDEVVDLKSSYRATAAAASNMHLTIDDGLAATGEGEYFSVPGLDNYLSLYKNSGGTHELVATYPKAADVERAGLDAASVAADRAAVESTASQVASDAAAAVAAKGQAETARDQAQAIADPEGAAQAVFDIHIVDVERRAFEAATGGACTIERNTDGEACHMHVFHRTLCEDLVPSGELGTGTHPAFIANGVEHSELLIGMYGAARGPSGTLVSQPGLVPRRSINWDNSRAEAQAAGFDIVGAWSWAAIAFWCMANGFEPRGNTDGGQSHSHPHERGREVELTHIATGTGPSTWRHNNAPNGIADLVGNLWEWVHGFKMVDGRIFLAPDNDPSHVESAWLDTGWDMPNASSTNFAGLYDADNEAPLEVRRALIMPNGVADPAGSLWTNLEGERFPSRGGNRTYRGNAGLSALTLFNERTNANTNRGLRLGRLVGPAT